MYIACDTKKEKKKKSCAVSSFYNRLPYLLYISSLPINDNQLSCRPSSDRYYYFSKYYDTYYSFMPYVAEEY